MTTSEIVDAGLKRARELSTRPESTYRLQFHAGFTFKDAVAILPYLKRLGITHVYASSYLTAAKGSTHGYDIIDHHSINPEVGTTADYEAFLSALKENGLGHILDTVPNHVGVATNDNAKWNDVLEKGRDSKWSEFFDIAWEASPRPEMKNRVLLPILGETYGKVLASGEFKIEFSEKGKLVLCVYDRRLPLSQDSMQLLAGKDLKKLTADELDQVISKQHYRLCYWNVASDEINYRRFFDVNSLAALRMDRLEVFEETHSFIFELLADGKVNGLRIDHPDGLYDPEEYLRRLQTHFVLACCRKVTKEKFDEKAALKEIESKLGNESPLYVVVEKILGLHEALPKSWAGQGTSGYDFLNQVNGLLVDRAGEKKMTEIWEGMTKPRFDGAHRSQATVEELIYQNKKMIVTTALSSELNALTALLDRVAQRDRDSRDFTYRGLQSGLVEVIACFGVYRTYITDDQVNEVDQGVIRSAVERAKQRNLKIDASIFEFIENCLLQKYPERFHDEDRKLQLRFAGKFQQLTSPVTAKGIEDTTFYQYHRLASLNEVGGEPGEFGLEPAKVHQYFAERAKDWPYAMSTLSTHDTKRSEDVRARIDVLSEIPAEWGEEVQKWRQLNGRLEQIAPEDEYLLYQVLVGAWERGADVKAFGKRLQEFMTKALREGKVRSSWIRVDSAYEAKVLKFVESMLDPEQSRTFMDRVEKFVAKVSRSGFRKSIAQTILKLTTPGVADTYQGTEVWDWSLVDPDNRRAVDYSIRQKWLGEIEAMSVSERAKILEDVSDPRGKLVWHWALLNARKGHPGLFTAGEYRPIDCENGFAFLRNGKIATVVGLLLKDDREVRARVEGEWEHLVTKESVHGRLREGVWVKR